MLGLRPRVGVNLLGLWPRVEAKFLWFLDQNRNLYVTILGQNKNIFTPKPIRNIFWPDRPRFHGEMSRQRIYAFGAILAYRWLVFQREIQEIQLENTRNTKIGVHHHERRVRGFRGYRTLWGSGRPTLRKIALTSCAIWGKYTFLRNTEIWFENTKNQGAPSQTLCSEVFVAIGHYGVVVI